MNMDHQLVLSDFVGEVSVESITRDQAGFDRIELAVQDRWFSRWHVEGTTTVGAASAGAFAHLLKVGARAVVFVAGGPWTFSSFTYRLNSVFAVSNDDLVSCTSGNPLFAVLESGFVCSAETYMTGPPLSLVDMRAQTLTRRQRAASRLSKLSARFDGQPRKLLEAPTPEASIDRTIPENEVHR